MDLVATAAADERSISRSIHRMDGWTKNSLLLLVQAPDTGMTHTTTPGHKKDFFTPHGQPSNSLRLSPS